MILLIHIANVSVEFFYLLLDSVCGCIHISQPT